MLLPGPVAADEARGPGPIVVDEHRVLAPDAIYGVRRAPSNPTHELALAAIYLDGAGWRAAEIVSALGEVGAILAQCGVGRVRVELARGVAPARYQDFHTPRSRELALSLQPPRPTLYFVADTRQRPAFDAEAIGRGNSSSRPELADSVWVTRAAGDLGVVLAHELAHVLMDSGAHADVEGNLMRDASAPANTRLTEEQCQRIRDVGTANGLLRPATATH
jgi:hypothetical protein